MATHGEQLDDSMRPFKETVRRKEDAENAMIKMAKKNWFERNTFWTAVIFAVFGAIFQWLTGLLPQL